MTYYDESRQGQPGMGRFNEMLVPRFSRFFQKLTGIKGGNPVPTLAPEVMPVHPIFHGNENRWLEQWDRYGGYIDRAAVAAFTSIRFRMPSTAPILAVLESIKILTGVADPGLLLYIGPVSTDLGAPSPSPGRLDARTERGNGAAIISAQTAAGIPGFNFGEIATQANTALELIATENQEITIMPGDAWQIVQSVLNSRFFASFIWRERYLEPSEVQGSRLQISGS